MSAAPPGIGPDCTTAVDNFTRRLQGLELASLRKEFAMLQFRIGTLAELPCDPERVQVLRQEIARHPAGGRLPLRPLSLPSPHGALPDDAEHQDPRGGDP